MAPHRRRGLRALLSGVAVTAISLGLLAVTPSAAMAAESVTSGTVAPSSPTYVHNDDPCSAGSEATHYSVIRARLVGPAASTLTVTVTPDDFTANLGVYQGVFLPDQPIVNCFRTVSGAGDGAPVSYSIPLVELLPGFTEQTFFFVVAGQSAEDVGEYSITVESTNATAVEVIEEDPVELDTEPPVITVPGTIVQEATGPNGAAVSFSASAEDEVDGTVPVACVPASGSVFPLGDTVVDCTASDQSDNQASSQFSVRVADTTGPLLTVPSDVTEEATAPDGAVVSFDVAAVDLVDGEVPVQCSAQSGDVFAVGITSVDCAATDAQGTTSERSFSVEVGDTTAPVLDLPEDFALEATGPTTSVDFTATAADLVDGETPVQCSVNPGDMLEVGTTTVDCAATDSRSNRAEGSFTITVEDTTAPIIDVPSDVTVDAQTPEGAEVDFAVSAEDLVHGAVPVECTPASGSLFEVGTTTVVCTASDPEPADSGLAVMAVATAEFSVTVRPYVAPPADDDVPGQEPANDDETADGLAQTGGEVSGVLAGAAVLLLLGVALLSLRRHRFER